MVSSKVILMNCIVTDDIYSSAGVRRLCVGTRQALLQGWLLCVGFVCLANVPGLVRWVRSLYGEQLLVYISCRNGLSLLSS